MAIVVSSAPTRELQRHFPEVWRAGYARICPQSNVANLPEQDLDGWLGLLALDGVAWAEAELRNARANMRPTIITGKVDVLTSATNRYFSVAFQYPTWTSTAHLDDFSGNDVALCRERLTPGRFRYFFGQLKGRRVVAEAHNPHDLARLRIGLVALAGRPCTVVVERDDESVLLHIPVSIPRPEHQLVLALATRDFSPPRKTFRLRTEAFLGPILSRLERLGCQVLRRHG